MELTSPFLLVTTWCVGVGTLAALVVYWRRLRGWLLAIRVVMMLLCELLLLFGIGLVINRTEDFYPTWSALLDSSSVHDRSTDRRANLAPWLQSKAAEGAKDGLTFPWRPEGGAGWGLNRDPTIFLPPAYFRSPTLSLPVIVMMAPPGLGAAQGGWQEKGIHAFARATGVPAVMLFIRSNSHLRVDRFIADLPVRLAADLRIAQHGWAMIAVGSAVPDGLDVFDGAPDRFGPLALVPAGATPLPGQLLDRANRSAGRQLFIAGHQPGSAKPPSAGRAGAAPTQPTKGTGAAPTQPTKGTGAAPTQPTKGTGPAPTQPAKGTHAAPSPATGAAGRDLGALDEALHWASGQLPPALAAPRELEPLPLPSGTPSAPSNSKPSTSPVKPVHDDGPAGP